jgi:hypothetical protein
MIVDFGYLLALIQIARGYCINLTSCCDKLDSESWMIVDFGYLLAWKFEVGCCVELR